MKIGELFKKGLLTENPTFRLVLGMCPTLAVTTEAKNGLAMGLATTAVLICSNVIISLLRKVVPNGVRIPVFVVVIASFVTIVELVLHAYFYSIYKVLGLFIPLIVVNCIILGRAEAFASKHPVFPSLIDGIAMGIGFTLSLTFLGCIREAIGNGTLFGVSVFGSSYQPFLLLILPPGAFITLGLLLGGINYLQGVKGKD